MDYSALRTARDVLTSAGGDISGLGRSTIFITLESSDDDDDGDTYTVEAHGAAGTVWDEGSCDLSLEEAKEEAEGMADEVEEQLGERPEIIIQ